MDLPGVAEVADACSTTWRDGDAWLGGGTWLFSEPQPALSRLLDLRAFGWPSLQVGQDGIEIAATCTLAEVARLRVPQWRAAPLIGQCCSALLGSFKVWNAATVGGNICLALPAGPMISLTSALDGICTIWSPGPAGTDVAGTDVAGTDVAGTDVAGTDVAGAGVAGTGTPGIGAQAGGGGAPRQIPVSDFVTGAGQSVLAPGELLRSVFLPARVLACMTAFRQLSLSPLGRSAALVIGRRSPADESVVITLTAATVRPVQLRFAGLPSPRDLRAAIAAAQPCYVDDVHGSPAWREAIARELALEVLAELAAPDPPALDPPAPSPPASSSPAPEPLPPADPMAS